MLGPDTEFVSELEPLVDIVPKNLGRCFQETYVQEFQSMGFTARAAGAYESRWNDIEAIMVTWQSGSHFGRCLRRTSRAKLWGKSV